jgi:hypothetical protein
VDKAQLVQKWIEATKPVGFLELREDMAKSLSQQMPDPESKAKIRKAIDLMDESKIQEVWRMFAEEHFSEDALEAGVTFFSSELGKKYREERVRASQAAMNAVHKHVFECVNKVFGIVP